jgi:hypothetical protein
MATTYKDPISGTVYKVPSSEEMQATLQAALVNREKAKGKKKGGSGRKC